MSRASKGFVLIVLLVGIAVCVRQQALGNETAWIPFFSKPAARFVFRFLTIAMGLGGWFVSQSLIGTRGLREGAISSTCSACT
ncbi:MAG: hypothetical protein HW394_1589 [Acidobacteria bacterium]|nr:hypothetical protein [Acidobacteriota bacterium]